MKGMKTETKGEGTMKGSNILCQIGEGMKGAIEGGVSGQKDV